MGFTVNNHLQFQSIFTALHDCRDIASDECNSYLVDCVAVETGKLHAEENIIGSYSMRMRERSKLLVLTVQS